MAGLDPEEERLIAEAMFETVNDDLSGQPFLEDANGNGDGENVPTSKVQFPIRRSKSSRKRKIFCVMTILFVLFGVLLLTYFILKAKTFTFEFKLTKGQVLHYRLSQEQTFEGLKTVHNSFSDDVYVEIVNKTGHNCWMKLFVKTLPSTISGHYAFLVSVNLEGQNSVDIDDEKRLNIFTPWKRNNATRDHYVLNLLTQLLPVVKIDLFEVILSQIATRKREVVVENSKFFSGDAVMKQNIRTNKDDILITSSIDPEGFSSFGRNSNLSPHISLSFEEDTSICKSTGMITTSDMELAAKIPISGEVGEDAKVQLSMRFKSSIRLVNEKKRLPHHFKKVFKFTELHELPTPSKDGLQYFTPSAKKYSEKSNVVQSIKEMLNMTLPHDLHSTKLKTNKDMEEFAKSFHKITQPGVETNFAEVQEQTKERHPDRFGKTTAAPKGNTEDRLDNDNSDDDNIDNDPSQDDDDDNNPNQYYYGRSGWNRFGQPVPQYPGDESDEDDADNDDDDPSEENGETLDLGKDSQHDARKTHQDIDDKKKDAKSKADREKEKMVSDGKKSDSKSKKEKVNVEHGKAEKATSEALYQEGKTLLSNGTNSKKDNPKRNNKLDKSKQEKTGKTMTTPAPQHEEKSLFDQIFDKLWNDDDDKEEQEAQTENYESGFKLSHFIPSFSFSSDFPFVHMKWNNSNTRKKRSLESPSQQRPKVRRDVKVHRDKRRLFNDDEAAAYYSGRDLEPIWDVVSLASITQHPKQTSQVFQHRIMGLELNGELEHEIKVVNSSSRGRNDKGWVINLSLVLGVDKHKFKVLRNTISMKEIEERFLRNSKPKLEYGTVHAGTLVLCSPLFYIENICVEIQLGFVLHISHTIESLTKEYPIELSIFFKHLAKVDVTIASHMTSLLGSHGVYGHGPLFGVKVPLEIRFSEERNSAKWCSVANVKSKAGDFFESSKDLSQWDCPVGTAVKSNAICKGLNKNVTHKAPARLWYEGAATKKLHILNSC